MKITAKDQFFITLIYKFINDYFYRYTKEPSVKEISINLDYSESLIRKYLNKMYSMKIIKSKKKKYQEYDFIKDINLKDLFNLYDSFLSFINDYSLKKNIYQEDTYIIHYNCIVFFDNQSDFIFYFDFLKHEAFDIYKNFIKQKYKLSDDDLEYCSIFRETEKNDIKILEIKR